MPTISRAATESSSSKSATLSHFYTLCASWSETDILYLGSCKAGTLHAMRMQVCMYVVGLSCFVFVFFTCAA